MSVTKKLIYLLLNKKTFERCLGVSVAARATRFRNFNKLGELFNQQLLFI